MVDVYESAGRSSGRDAGRGARRLRALLVVLGGALAAPLAAAPPQGITDAEVRHLDRTTPTAAIELAARASRDSGESVWLAYRVESVVRMGSICCFRATCCDLDDDRGFYHGGEPRRTTDPVLVFARLDDGRPRRLRVTSSDCTVGLGGRTVFWLGDVSPGDSLELLAGWLDEPGHPLAEETLPAIAYHRGVAATDILTRVAEGARGDLARDAIFWLGTARGQAGYERLDALLTARPDRERTKAIVFALHQSPVRAADERLIELATGDDRSEIRREALFWLGQGTTHADLILEAAFDDPDDDVARHAVFVLSQMPEPTSVELLTRVLVQDERREIRKEALFWIGQSDSPDALEIVGRILNQ